MSLNSYWEIIIYSGFSQQENGESFHSYLSLPEGVYGSYMFQGFKQYLWSIQDWDARSLQSSRAFSAFFWIVRRMSPSTLWLLSIASKLSWVFSMYFFLFIALLLKTYYVLFRHNMKSIHWWLYRQHVIAETSQLGKQEPTEPMLCREDFHYITPEPRCDCVVSPLPSPEMAGLAGSWDILGSFSPRMRRRARNVCSMRRTSWGHLWMVIV